MSYKNKNKKRVVYQERQANRQAMERLKQAYIKLYTQNQPEKKYPVKKEAKKITVQEKKE